MNVGYIVSHRLITPVNYCIWTAVQVCKHMYEIYVTVSILMLLIWIILYNYLSKACVTPHLIIHDYILLFYMEIM